MEETMKRPRLKSTIRLTLLTSLVAALCLLGVAAWAWFGSFDQTLLSAENLTSTRITDRHGRDLREVLAPGGGRARMVDLDDISPALIDATLHSEDHRFWSHPGVDARAIARASWQNARNLRVISGASTITQQVVKLLYQGSRAGARPNKLREAALALRLEKIASKRDILAQYLNRAPYGNQLFGVAAASWMYFNKPPAQLSLAEASLLAGIPRAPSRLNPYKNLSAAKNVQKRILKAMLDRNAITKGEYNNAIAEKLVILPRDGRLLAPHFSDYILSQLDELGYDPLNSTRPALVETTLDLDLQETVQSIVRAELKRLSGHNLNQAAVLVLDTQSGEALAWVGSRDYWDDELGGANDGVTTRRQPGSALKPFIYGLFFEQGHTPAEAIADLPREFPAEKGLYIPKNYDGRYHGPVSAREALASSLNIPAVDVAQKVGVPEIVARLQELGMDTFKERPEHYGLGIALGNGEVRLKDLSAAYATLGRMGTYKPVQITLSDPMELAEAQRGDEAKIFSDEIAYLLLDILSDDAARARGFGRHSAIYFPYQVAAKTGTSSGFRDNWTFGVTPQFTVGVWAGNFDGAPMKRSSGITGAGPIMRQVMQALHPEAAGPKDAPGFKRPDTLETHKVCALSGHKPGPDCLTTREELFAPDTWTERPCPFHTRLAIDTRNDLLATNDCPSEVVEERLFLTLPREWIDWARERGEPIAPEEYSPHCPIDPFPF